MARPTLYSHRKFRRLTAALDSEALALGHLEWLWQAAYESGDERLGDSTDVEAVARWRGEPGKLVGFLAAAGFIDADGAGWRVHDLWDHAPEYVRRRRSRERQRHDTGRSLSSQCPVTDGSMGHTPTPAPTPAPTPTRTPAPKATTCAEPEPAPASAPPFGTWPTVGKGPKWWQPPGAMLVSWREDFPTVDIPAELHKAHAWIVANPERRKTARGMPRFLTGWLTRATNNGSRSSAATPKPTAQDRMLASLNAMDQEKP